MGIKNDHKERETAGAMGPMASVLKMVGRNDRYFGGIVESLNGGL